MRINFFEKFFFFLYKYVNISFLLGIIMNDGHPNGVIQLVEIRELEALRGHS
jgi:hypothetical protein